MIRRFFAGSVTGSGYCNLYGNIIDRDNCSLFVVIKGGSGVGKSSMLKKTAKHFIEKGYSAEYYHCSADVDSLDGIVFPELSVAVIDGTAPHVIDPVYVKLSDYTVDLGKYIDGNTLSYDSEIIKSIIREKNNCYKIAEVFISCAAKVFDHAKSLVKNHINYDEVLCKIPILESKSTMQKRLFASAITSNGEIYLENDTSKSVSLFKGEKPILSCITDKITCACDFDTVSYAPFSTGDVFELEGKGIILTSNDKVKGSEVNTVSIDRFVEGDVLSSDGYRKCTELFERNIFETTVVLDRARKLHAELESYYRKAVDFSAVDKETQSLIAMIGEVAKRKAILNATE